jgi:predicted metal-dependent hydrolase
MVTVVYTGSAMRTSERTFVLVLSRNRYFYTLRRSRRARHILIHVSAEGTIEVVVPRGRTFSEAHAFVRDRKQWIVKTLQRYRSRGSTKKRLVSGACVPVLDRRYTLRVKCQVGRRRSFVRCGQECIEVRVGSRRQVREALRVWYRRRALARFSRWAHYYAALLGVSVQRVVVSDFKTQWGSCVVESARLAFNWRLLLAPGAVARYVVAHEVAHLLHGNHSPRFWAVVAQLDPCFDKHRRWLRTAGHTLNL